MSSQNALDKIFSEDSLSNEEKNYFLFHKDRFKKILKFIINENREQKIFEVGCGSGFILRGCYNLGFNNLFACDFYDLSQNIFLNKYKIIFSKYEASADKLPRENFDLIFFSEVLEHFNFYPRKVFEEIYRALNSGGKLIITTPNLVRLNNRLKLLMGRSINFDIKEEYSAGTHYREYTADEITYLLKSAGFSSIETRFADFDYPNVHIIVKIVDKIFSFFNSRFKSNLIIIAKK